MEARLGREFVWNSEQSHNNSNNNRVTYHTAINIIVKDVFVQTLFVNIASN